MQIKAETMEADLRRTQQSQLAELRKKYSTVELELADLRKTYKSSESQVILFKNFEIDLN